MEVLLIYLNLHTHMNENFVSKLFKFYTHRICKGFLLSHTLACYFELFEYKQR